MSERSEGREEGLALAILLVSGVPDALHRFARGAGITGEELERLLSGPLCVMLAALGRIPTFEEEVDKALGGEP